MARTKLLAVVIAGALALAACGDDGGDDSADTAAPADTTAAAADTTEAATDTTEAAATDTTEAAGDETTTSAAEGGGGAEFVVNTDDCEDPDAANAVIEGDIKIGSSMPLSGGPAALFAPFADGFQSYFEWVNANEGGLNGQQLVPIVKDDQYTADLTKTAVDELLFEDEVALVSGVIGSPNNAAIIDDMNAQCVPQLWASTGSPAWGAVNAYPWTTGLLVPYPIEVRAWFDFVKQENPDASTIGIIAVNNEFGQAYIEAANEFAGDAGLEIVAEETLDAADSGAPSGQVTNLVAANPDAILAVPLGAQCIAFMSELGNQKAANPDFNPPTYLTATCASVLFFNAAGAGADGVYTSLNVKDVANPANASDPAVAAYSEAYKSVSPDADPANVTALAGWLAAEYTVHVLKEAAASEDGLTRASIINAARNIDVQSPLAREGLTAHMDAEDGYIAEGTQIVQWSAAEKVHKDVGEVLNYEGSLGVYEP
jgi:branched-chain amino acid transport system substrate-binding protein